MKNIIESNLSFKLKEFLNHAIKLYKQQLSSFLTQMHRNKENVKNLQDEQFFNSAFEPGQDKILIEGDKNIGYVCMFLQDLLQQYEKINFQQHFWKISEIIFRIAELSIFNTLARHHLQSTRNWYLRFRDHVSVHIVGAPDDICKAIKVICTGYPKDIIFNML